MATGTAQVVNGFLVADVATIKEVLKQLKADLAADPELKKEFQLNPGVVLGERGLSLPVQKELGEESGVIPPNAGLNLLGCSFTCLHTNGCVFFTS